MKHNFTGKIILPHEIKYHAAQKNEYISLVFKKKIGLKNNYYLNTLISFEYYQQFLLSMAKGTNKIKDEYGLIRFLAALIKELGIPAFVVLFFTVTFVTVANSEQKKEFVNEFFLFKDVNKNPFPFAFVVLALILIIILQYIFYNKIIENHKEEMRRVSDEKSKLQSGLTGKTLHSSKNK